MSIDISQISRALADRAEAVSTVLLGRPSESNRHELRWGKHGSLSMCRSGNKRGLWFNYETGEGGDLLNLIARARNARLSEAVGIAEREFLCGKLVNDPPDSRRRAADDDLNERYRVALRIWSEAETINGTLAERYLVRCRGLDVTRLDLEHALRWNARIRAVIALMTDAVSGAAIGIHRTFLDASGAKIERKMLGRQGVVRLSADDAVTMSLGIAEGIEDGLAVLLSGWAPVWAATSAGAIARLPVLGGVEALTIFADTDQAGLQAAEISAARWRSIGREVLICTPEPHRG